MTLCEICTAFKVGGRQDRVIAWRVHSDTWNVGNEGHVEAASSNGKGSTRIHRIQIQASAQLRPPPRTEWAVDEKVIEQLRASVEENDQTTTKLGAAPQITTTAECEKFACGQYEEAMLLVLVVSPSRAGARSSCAGHGEGE